MKSIEQINRDRRAKVLKAASIPGGTTVGTLAKMFKVSRGTIVSDIKILRAEGNVLEVSSLRMEDGLYQMVFELRTLPQRQNTSAAPAESLCRSANTGGRFAG